MNSPKFRTMGHLKLYNFFELEQDRQLAEAKNVAWIVTANSVLHAAQKLRKTYN